MRVMDTGYSQSFTRSQGCGAQNISVFSSCDPKGLIRAEELRISQEI